MGFYDRYKKTCDTTTDGDELWFSRDHESLCIKKTFAYYDKPVFYHLHENRNKHIPQILDYFPEDGNLIVFMRFIRGRTLEEYLKAEDPGDAKKRQILGEVFEALEFLHSPKVRIVHGSLKTADIIISDRGGVYITGFEDAKVFKPSARDVTKADLRAAERLIKRLIPSDDDAAREFKSVQELRKAFPVAKKKKKAKYSYRLPVLAVIFALLVALVVGGICFYDSDANKASLTVSTYVPIATPTPAPTLTPTPAPATAAPTKAHDLTAQELNDGNGRMYSYKGLVEDVMEIAGISEREAMKAVNDLHLDFNEQADSYAHAYMTYYMDTYPIDVRNAMEDVGFTKDEIDYVMGHTSLESSAQLQGKARDYLYKLASEKTYKRTSDYRQAMRDMGFGKAFINDAFLSSGGFEIKKLVKKGKVINDDKTVLPTSDSDD